MTQAKPLPLHEALLREIADTYGTPVFVYDEAGIRASARRLREAFSWSKGYKNYFSVKATPTPGILNILVEEGMGLDCSSRGELELVKRYVPGADIFFTSNNTPDEDYQLAHDMGAVINIDKYPYLQQVMRAVGGAPAAMAVRLNPGTIDAGNHIIGTPAESKFGDTMEHTQAAVADMHKAGVKRIGLHTMLVSNELDPGVFAGIAQFTKQTAVNIQTKTGVRLSFLNIGGGLGIDYTSASRTPDAATVGQLVKDQLADLDIPVYSEFGRYITGPHGLLLTRVTHGFTKTYENYLQVDTSVNNLPGYASDTTNEHDIQVLGRDTTDTVTATVVGSMCTNSDRMFKDRQLPKTTQPGDLLIVHDAGAHARAKAHNYNLRLRAGEVLVRPDGSHELIRRHETVDDLFDTFLL